MRLSMRVWDLPIRLFHAATVLLLIAGVATAASGHFGWHAMVGEALVALLAWRLIWGVVGSDTARWAAFARAPWAGFGQADTIFSGGWLVPLMLALMAALVGSGWAQHEAAGASRGVWARVHGAIGWALLGAIVLHVGIVIGHGVGRGEGAVRAMLSGKQRMPAAMRAPRLGSAWFAALVLFCAAGGMALVAGLLGGR